MEIRGAAIKRPGDLGDAAPDENLRRFVARPHRDIGVAFRQIESLVSDDDLEAHAGIGQLEFGEERRQQMHKKRVVGGDEEITFWRDLLTGDSATESRYVGASKRRASATISSPTGVRA